MRSRFRGRSAGAAAEWNEPSEPADEELATDDEGDGSELLTTDNEEPLKIDEEI